MEGGRSEVKKEGQTKPPFLDTCLLFRTMLYFSNKVTVFSVYLPLVSRSTRTLK